MLPKWATVVERCPISTSQIGGLRLFLRSYEGGLAPTLRMKPGETLKIRLINDLPPNRDQMPMNASLPHQFNNTNFHFHGVHASPSGISDNVMRSMEPGHTYDIEVRDAGMFVAEGYLLYTQP